MSKYDQLKQKINGLEQADFQQVSNNYLLKRYGGRLESPGTMDSKTKTRKGKPDTYLVQDDGSYIIAEITTHDASDKPGFREKLINDLNGCLNFASLGITANQVRYIVLCCNSTVDIPLWEELKKIIEPNHIELKIASLLTLVDFYYNTGKVFARDVLSIPFETGQVLSKAEFLARYRGHKQITTPLDNTLYGRERELEYAIESLAKYDTLLISGNAGIGKSRLALQVIDNFIVANPLYQPYYILSVRESIFEDLLTFLVPGQPYIVFIDDANRQIDNVVAVINRAVAAHIKVKIVMTVRDYARRDVDDEIKNFNPLGIVISDINEDTLNNILYHEPFNIQEYSGRRRIIEVSKGNARLALMAADVLAKNPDSAILKDASSIYDAYFNNLTTDLSIFNDPLTIKVLGILAFLESIDYEEPGELKTLELFDIPVPDFIQTVSALESIEFVDVRFQSIAKIGDQVLGTYFFYQAFFKRRLLSPKTLMFNLFEKYKWRVQDTFLPAITTFGVENVLGDNPEFLTDYLEQIKGVEPAAISFFDVFGPYLPYKLFVFIKQLTDSLPIDEGDFNFTNAYKRTQINHPDPILRLLEPFYKKTSRDFITASGLAIQYVQKRKGMLDQLVNQLKEPLWADGNDKRNDFEKQFTAYNFLKTHLNDSPIFKYLFYYVFQHVCLNTRFNHEVYEFVDGKDIFTAKFAELRNLFWDDLFVNYAKEKTISYELLMEYLEGKGNESIIYLTSDQPKVTTIIKNYLSPKDFGDCCFVQGYIDLLIDKHVEIIPELRITQKRFHSQEYKTIKALSLERNEKRQKFRSYLGTAAGNEVRIKYLSRNLPVSSFEDFQRINKAIQVLLNYKYHHQYQIGMGLTLIFENLFEQNKEIGFETLQFYLNQERIISVIPARLYYAIIRITGDCERLYQIIANGNFQYKQDWLERFYETIPETCITEHIIQRMLADYQNASNYYTLHLEWFLHYDNIKEGTVRDLCAVLLNKSQNDPEYRFKIDYFFIEKYGFLIEKDFEFSKRLYINQDRINHDFDPRGSELFAIMKKDPLFIREYMDYRLQIYKEFHSAPSMLLTEIWEFEQAEDLVYHCLLKFGVGDIYGYNLNSFSSNFFLHLKPEFLAKAITVLKRLIDDFPDNPKFLSMVWEIGRNYLKDKYAELIQYWIIKKPTLELFRKCDWSNNSFSYNGNKQFWGDYRAGEYTLVSNAIAELSEPYLYINIQEWLTDRIAREKSSADWERKRHYRRWD